MSENKTHYDVIIIGSGPAGYTAAIYTGRANLKTLVLEGLERGGQLMITNELENFPGFPDAIIGPDFMELLRKQAQKFGAELITALAEEVQLKNAKPFKIKADGKNYTSDSVIIATGATARFMGIPSEKEYKGRGVSACATCDGFFFKNKHVIVVGGGDSAMEEANFLTKFATKVTVVHRRDVFKASPIMVDRARNNPKVEILTFKVIEEIYGDPSTGTVAGVKLKDVRDNSLTDFPVQGVFVAVGHDPNTTLFAGQLPMDESKYLITKPGKTATEIPGVFAAGDVQDSYYRQAITAAGSGCQAAIEAEKYLESIH
ncbi:MAG: thioredoxin-disulfide reductase [Spirochaetia bacterium]|nr:thioredoxin-disulfide reductase [Spirochaetia bacterium]